MNNTRKTRQRATVLQAVRELKNHPSADEIYALARQKDEKISRGTVYRNLSILARSGEVNHVKVPAADRYDFRLDLHYHMFCVKCGAVSDAPIEYNPDYDLNAAKATGFKVARHRLIFEGLCSKCLSEEENK